MKYPAVFSLALLLGMLAYAYPAPTQAHTMHARSFPVTLVDDLHNHVRIASRPKRLLSLDPRDTETLFALGLEQRVVGDGSQYSEGAAGLSRPFRYPQEWPSRWGRDYPVRAKTLPHVEGGYGQTPFNLETIESLHPDLIVSLNTDAPTLQKLRELGLTVIILDPTNVRGIMHDIQLVGRATGATTQAAVVINAVKKKMAAVRKRLIHVRTHPRVYYEIDATNPAQPFTAGPGTFIDETIRLAGGRNVTEGITSLSCPGRGCYPQLNLEALVKLNPQLIFLGDAAYGTTVESVKKRSGWSTMAAIRSGKIYPFNDELISRAGPRIIIGLQQLARRIHPEAIK